MATPVNRKKNARKLTCGDLFLQDNAPVNTPQVAMTAATECRFGILPHPPYSPDMVPVPKTEISSSRYTVWKQ